MNWKILNKYTKGKCSPEELRQLQFWLNEDAANEDFFQSFVEGWKSDPDVEVGDVRKAWEEFKGTHLNKKEKARVLSINKNDYNLSKTWRASKGQKGLMLGSAAAVIIALVLTGVFLFQTGRQATSYQSTQKLAYRTIITKKGHKIELRLKDGTDVMLNAASKLRIPENYGDAKRVVYLQGEAFFKVVHNENMPFTVKSGQLVIQDVGTQFNVSAYDSANVSVAVKEGAVSVGKETVAKSVSVRHLVQLDGGKVGYFDDTGTKSVSAIQNMALFTGWTKDKLVFQDTPFSMVVKRLERQFSIKGKILGKTLKQRTLTATYSGLSLDQILHVLSVSLHISYQQDHNTIIFKPKK